MRISDWSSDVCSSDLRQEHRRQHERDRDQRDLDLAHRVGHVRAFAIFAACASTTAILHALFVSPLFWAMLRVITGACMVGLYTVVESWLNTRAAPAQRSRLFESYRVVNFTALTAGQFLLALYPVSGFQLFVITATLV